MVLEGRTLRAGCGRGGEGGLKAGEGGGEGGAGRGGAGGGGGLWAGRAGCWWVRPRRHLRLGPWRHPLAGADRHTLDRGSACALLRAGAAARHPWQLPPLPLHAHTPPAPRRLGLSALSLAPPPRSYLCYLAFQLKTHSNLFKGDDDDAVPMMTLGTSIGLLTFITAIVAVCSEFLTDSIEAVSKDTGLSQAFIGELGKQEAGGGRHQNRGWGWIGTRRKEEEEEERGGGTASRVG